MEENKNNSSRTDELGTEPIGKLMVRLSAPAIVAQVINLLYNLVDRIYIGHIPDVGQMALTGVGVCLPLIMIISAFACLGGMGSAPRASIFLGKGDKDRAEQTLGNAAALMFLISVVLTAVIFIFAEDMLLLFGASGNTISYAVSYMRIYCCGTLFVQFTLGLNAFITAQGFARTSMLTVLIGAVTNIVLDPILIFGLNMGVGGAALATIISQCISMLWILRFLTGPKTVIRIRRKNLRLSAQIVLPSVALGLAPFIMQSTESLLSVCFNSSLLKYGGDIAVATMTIAASVMQFSLLPLQGLTQGAQPIISYNYGAKNTERVKKTLKIMLISCLTYSMATWALVMIAPQIFVKLFNNSPELLEFSVPMLRTYMAATGVFGIQIACQQTFISVGNAKSSLFLALLRKIFLLIPLIYIMPVLFDTNKTWAVFFAEPVADAISVTTAGCMFFMQVRRIMRETKGEKAVQQ